MSEDRILRALRHERFGHLCSGCLALDADLSLEEARALITLLVAQGVIELTHSACSLCLREISVVRARAA